MPVNTVYPNIPKDFHIKIKEARLANGYSLREALKLMGSHKPAATLSQIEAQQRNCTYDFAVRLRDFYNLDIDLPKPDKSKQEPLYRNRHKKELKRDRFLVEVDGRIIEVVTYYDIGEVKVGERHDKMS